MLPFAIVLWVFSVSIKWVRYGGELRINLGEPVIDPKELLSVMKDLNTNILTLIEETK